MDYATEERKTKIDQRTSLPVCAGYRYLCTAVQWILILNLFVSLAGFFLGTFQMGILKMILFSVGLISSIKLFDMVKGEPLKEI